MTRDRDAARRLEIFEMFEGLSIFDRGPSRGRPSTIGYRLVGSWIAPKPREAKAKAPPKPKRVKQSPEERRRKRAERETNRYRALPPTERRQRNSRLYASVRGDAERLEARRAAAREWMRKKRAETRKPAHTEAALNGANRPQ